ncbi:hypothetical protein CHGG_10564 [Chaetomium globosum CBS 148.51]|uniref:Bromo domain-containing protein n=1 Tax=Chaetomium globosum (strain ATCC 6205 / CBS 148.51 / DSM 1962 / NBRC 6347 / NRRL 1970) TaxID=306901 RepID=Q2GN90_CHAGB|nr:uncharacterized protein CHGG_10564 [Chaetomium globosum CBS 148.51]EAQ84160.1 hypothetical protein CHGG_10564 [Chaetomium globosum CBS 148.51]
MAHGRTSQKDTTEIATSTCNRSNPNENSRPSATDRRDSFPIPQIDRSAGLGLPIVAPIHLVENHPLGSPRGGIWGMNTSTTPHTPLEKLLLFRGIANHGIGEGSFVTIAGILQNNNLIKNDDTFDAQRLNPESLRDLFLRLLREEVRVESENTLGPDGALSPASKKRKLQSPPPLTLKDARQHIGKLESAYNKIYDAYLNHTADEIRKFEEQYDELDGEIKELEKLGTTEPDTGPKPPTPQGALVVGKHEPGPSSRVGPSPGALPRPPQVPVSSTSQQALRNLQPLLPQPTTQKEVRNGLSPLQPAAPEKVSSAPRPSAPTHPELARSPQLGPQEVSRVPVTKSTAVPKSQNTAPQVLQAPQGVTSFQPPQSPVPPPAGDGLQRPESAPGARQSPSLPGNVLPAQGQLKWEPPYQPNTPWRHATNPQQQQQQDHQQQPNMPNTPSQPIPPSRGSQQPAAAHPSSVAIQGQTTRPLHPQQVLIPPHSTAQFAAPLQSPQVRAPADSITEPGKQQPLHPTAAASNAPQPQSPYVPPYQGHPVPTPSPATPLHPTSQVPPPSPSRAAAIPAVPTPPVAVPSRPSPGLAAQQPQHRAALQPPSYNQQHAPRGGPSPAPGPPDAGQRYSSPYQPPRPAAVDRIHPRFPVTSTPTRAAKFSPAPSAPQTPTMTLPTRLAKGSGTKWVSNSTPSTPKPGIEFRLGYDDVPSPAYEPTSPVLRPSAPPVLKQAPKREGPTETPKHKPGRQPAPQRPQGISTPQPGPRPTVAMPADSQVKQAAMESEPPKVKHEVTTPRRSTEAGDTTADESLTPTPGRAPRASQLREALSEGLNPADPPKLVLWTRSFNKVCGSAMEQIVHHRSANMFAAPIREKDAPGYHKVVKQAQDLKTIRAAISHGNRAAAQAAAALPDGADQGSSSGVWLPRTHELMPPKSIINSSQLDRELAHMFSNAVMYNPDPHHGPGPAFLRPEVDEDEEVADADAGGGGGSGGGGGGVAQDSGVLGYKVDEFGVVNDARAMFVEVEKLLSELRSAEVRRNVPPGASGGGGDGDGDQYTPS